MSDGDSRLRDGRDLEVPVEPIESTEDDQGGLRAGLRRRAGALFSLRTFLLGTVACLGGLFVVGGLVPLGIVGELLGVLLGGFALGLASSETNYAELTLAGAVAGGVGALLDNLVLAVVGIGLPLVATGALAGGAAGLIGHYFGSDLRHGLTRDISQ